MANEKIREFLLACKKDHSAEIRNLSDVYELFTKYIGDRDHANVLTRYLVDVFGLTPQEIISEFDGKGVLPRNLFYKINYNGPYEIILPESIEFITTSCFQESNIKSIVCTGVKSIEDRAFQGCEELRVVITSKELLKVCYRAFNGCSSLSSIDLTSVTTIENLAFKNCKNLTEIHIPNIDYYKLSPYSFQDCDNLILYMNEDDINKLNDTFHKRDFMAIEDSVKEIRAIKN